MKTVREMMLLGNEVDGDLGIEIEVEGYRLPIVKKYWRNEDDGSLKGPETREYVLKMPVDLAGVAEALNYLEKEYVAHGTVVEESIRAGIHVHVNCQKLTMKELYNFFVVYLILENVLVQWCGGSRVGNLFCLRAQDAENLITKIKLAAVTSKFRGIFRDNNLRYASMNVKALGDYGSLEFRAMRGTRDFNLVYKWAKTLLGLRGYARQFDSPKRIIEIFSMLGPSGFMQQALGEEYELFTSDNEEELLWDGVRNAQDVAYCCDWDKFCVEDDNAKIANVKDLRVAFPDFQAKPKIARNAKIAWDEIEALRKMAVAAQHVFEADENMDI